MALFKDFIKKKEEKSGTKRAALVALGMCVKAMAEDTQEETIRLRKRPCEGERKGLDIGINYNASPMGGPVYAYYLIESIARACDVSFESMISMARSVKELLPEITDTEDVIIVGEETKESDGED